MILDGLRQGSMAAPESRCRRKNALSDLKNGELDINGEAKKQKNFRRKKMELRRNIRSVSEEESVDPLILSDDNVSSKKKRTDVKKAIKLIENALPERDGGGSRDAASPPHGMISVIGRRREMEDAVAVELGFLKKGEKSYNFFGVYDGHGGWRVARACSEMLHKLLVEIVEEEEEDDINVEEIAWERVMAAGFRKMDEEVNKSGAAVATTGSTAVVAVVGEEVVVVANCGDSRAVLSRGGVAVQLSDDHKPDRPDELERIEGCGGKVINWNGHRVLGVLATSRSIGDDYLKPFVITDPEVKIMNRSKSDEFLVLASDGVWDVISNELACQVTRRCLDGRMRRSVLKSSAGFVVDDDDRNNNAYQNQSRPCVEAAAMLAELAMARGSDDNISVVVVDLKHPAHACYPFSDHTAVSC